MKQPDNKLYDDYVSACALIVFLSLFSDYPGEAAFAISLSAPAIAVFVAMLIEDIKSR